MVNYLIPRLGLLFGLFSIPTLFKKPSIKLWLPLYLINCIINYLFNKYLVESNKLKYPKKLISKKITNINVSYDIFVCPFLSVWFCQSTYKSNIRDFLVKLFIFALPQGVYEIVLERKTDTLKFKKNWKWFHSIFLVFIVKLLSRGVLELLKKLIYKNDPTININ
jgi:hypothetical protein